MLISVRSPAEVQPALRGGADIIDAKDPARGALGAMERVMLSRVVELVPPSTAFSVALGDPPNEEAAAELIASLPIPARDAPTYVKLGFAGIGNADAVERMLVAVAAAAGQHAARPTVIAVVYADDPGGLGLREMLAVANRAAVTGVLVDTVRKDGGSLLDAVPRHRLDGWIGAARTLRLLVGLAGRLDRPEIARLAHSGADVLGVRGAACDGGRAGSVSARRVRALHNLLCGAAKEYQEVAKHQSPSAWHSRLPPRK